MFIGISRLQQELTLSRMGRSRSVSIILAYLMESQNIDYYKAYDFVQKRRDNINPNAGFVQQLLVWNTIKHDWKSSETYPEYRYWRMANDACIVARTSRTVTHKTDVQKTIVNETDV